MMPARHSFCEVRRLTYCEVYGDIYTNVVIQTYNSYMTVEKLIVYQLYFTKWQHNNTIKDKNTTCTLNTKEKKTEKNSPS